MDSVNAVLRMFAMLAAVVPSLAATAAPVRLDLVTCLDRKAAVVDLAAAPIVKGAEMTVRVTGSGDGCTVELSYQDLRPAALLGGNVLAYVVWSVAADAKVTNLGTVWALDDDGTMALRATGKSFALLITAEADPAAHVPSELVCWTSTPPQRRGGAATRSVSFAGLVAAPAHQLATLASARPPGGEPIELFVARRAFARAERAGVAGAAPGLMEEARTTLAQATNSATSASLQGQTVTYAKKTVGLLERAFREAGGAGQAAAAPPVQVVATVPDLSVTQYLRDQCYANTCVGAVHKINVFDPASQQCTFWFALPCFPYRCADDGRACTTSCLTAGDCAQGAYCSNGTSQCAPWAHRCKGPWTVIDSHDSETSCTPYQCESGACRETCDSEADCYAGYACIDHHCMAKN